MSRQQTIEHLLKIHHNNVEPFILLRIGGVFFIYKCPLFLFSSTDSLIKDLWVASSHKKRAHSALYHGIKNVFLMSSNILFAKNIPRHLKGNDPIWTIDDLINL